MTELERPNRNCLDGIRCPECGSHEPFYIDATVTLKVWDDGADDYANDPEWNHESPITCVTCQHSGVVADFGAKTETESGDSEPFPYTVGIVGGAALARFATEQEAAEYIGTLPNADAGRYYLDGPENAS